MLFSVAAVDMKQSLDCVDTPVVALVPFDVADVADSIEYADLPGNDGVAVAAETMHCLDAFDLTPRSHIEN
jgi:hypothetical protein